MFGRGVQSQEAFALTTFNVSSGQTVSGQTLQPGDEQFVLSGGRAVSTFVLSGAKETIQAGGLALYTQVENGGVEQVRGGESISAVIGSGGRLVVSAGGVANFTTVSAGGFEVVSAGGSVTSSFNEGSERIGAGGMAQATTNDGDQYVQSGGVAIKTVNNNEQVVSGGGVAQQTVNNGAQFIHSGGVASGTRDAGQQTVYAGGVASTTNIVSGGLEFVLSGGTAVRTTVSAGGSMSIASNGLASGTFVASGGVVTVAGGLVEQAVVQAFGQIDVNAGTTSGTIVSGLESLDGTSGAVTALRSLVQSGGVEYVGLNSLDSATVVASGGLDYVDIGGQSVGVVVSGGGRQDVIGIPGGSSGVASDTTVLSGAILGVYNFSGTTGPLDPSQEIVDTHLLAGGTIDLSTNLYAPGATANFDQATDVLTISGEGTAIELQFSGSYTDEYFHLSNDGNGGTDVTVDQVACYCPGTLILTDRGEVPIEALVIGDGLVTVSGAVMTLRWIGKRGYDGRFIRANRDVLPVTLRAGCLDGVVPRRDLVVSPLHALYLDGVLIPAVALVNGVSIVQAEAVARIDYLHLELERHAVIFAEGVAAESYVDDSNRGMFHNAAEYQAGSSDAVAGRAVYCALRADDGAVVDAVRRRIAALSAPEVARACRGYLDQVRRDCVIGWAIDEAQPGRAVRVRLRDNGVVIGSCLADRARTDLRAAGIGDGAHGFVLDIPGGLAPDVAHRITGETEDGTQLGGELTLAAIAVGPADGEAAGLLRCHVDLVERSRVLGWAVDEAAPGVAVAVQIVVDGVVAARVLANRYRRDVAEAGLANGRCAFEHCFTPPLSPAVRHVVELRCEASGQLLAEPCVVEAASGFDPALEAAIGAAVAGLGDSGSEARVLAFLEAQAERLRQNRAAARAGSAARAQAAHRREAPPLPRALVIDHEWPDARRDAGSAAVLSHCAALRSLGYEVSFVASRQMEQAPPAALAALGIEACAAPFYASVEEVLRRQAYGFDVVYLHRVGNAARYLTLARDHQPGARVIFAVADLHHLRLARAAVAQDRPELAVEARLAQRAEAMAAAQADVVLTHSPVEAAMLRRLAPRAVVQVAPWQVGLRKLRTCFARRSGVGFLGNYAHAPNLDAVRFLVGEVMPRVWAVDGAIGCVLAGSAMPAEVAALAGPRVRVLGAVDEPGVLFEQVRLSIAPLRYGAGIKGKVLESLAYGVPCIVSPVAAEGITLPEALIGADAAGLAAAILRLHGGGAAYKAAAREGRAMVAQAYGEEATFGAIAAAVGPVARARVG
jgi:autotransporter passenger strand-loop-strand repeat protein